MPASVTAVGSGTTFNVYESILGPLPHVVTYVPGVIPSPEMVCPDHVDEDDNAVPEMYPSGTIKDESGNPNGAPELVDAEPDPLPTPNEGKLNVGA